MDCFRYLVEKHLYFESEAECLNLEDEFFLTSDENDD